MCSGLNAIKRKIIQYSTLLEEDTLSENAHKYMNINVSCPLSHVEMTGSHCTALHCSTHMLHGPREELVETHLVALLPPLFING